MEKRRIFALLMSICMLLMAVVACAEEDVIEEDICVDFDTYNMGVIAVVEDDWNGGTTEGEYGGIGLIVNESMTIGELLEQSGYFSFELKSEEDEFEGWMEYKLNIVADEDGFEDWVYERISDALYSTEELMALPTPEESIIYIAKWASIPVEEYFAETEASWGDVSFGGSFTVLTEEGSIVFSEYDEEYEYPSYTYWLEEGQTLADVAGENGEWATIVSVNRENAEFTGWTVYMTADLLWESEISEEEGVLSFLSNSYGDENLYISIRDYTIIGENVTTEELMTITVGVENYLAVANWA